MKAEVSCFLEGFKGSIKTAVIQIVTKSMKKIPIKQDFYSQVVYL